MLRGDTVGLRARREADVAVLHSELYEDVATRSRADSRAWRPLAVGPAAAHIGVSLLPAFRGRGFGSDVVGVLCAYGFSVLGLHRLQAETIADNRAMQRAAMKSGFVLEGTMRRSAWVDGDFVDDVLLGLLATEWHAT